MFLIFAFKQHTLNCHPFVQFVRFLILYFYKRLFLSYSYNAHISYISYICRSVNTYLTKSPKQSINSIYTLPLPLNYYLFVVLAVLNLCIICICFVSLTTDKKQFMLNRFSLLSLVRHRSVSACLTSDGYWKMPVFGAV